MIKRFILISLIGCFYSTITLSLPTNKGKYNQLRQSLDSISLDSTTFGQRYGTSLDEIFLDNYQVINALSVQNDSLKKSSSSLETNYLTMMPKLTVYRYIIYGLAALALIFLVFVLLFLIKSSKLTKSLKQKNMEQGKFNSEMEKITATLANEAEQHKSSVEIFEKDKNQLLSEIQLKTNECEHLKSSIEILEKDKYKWQEQIQHKTKENEQLKQEIEEKNNAFTSLRKSVEELKMQQESMDELHRQEQGNLQQHIQKNDELTNQINDLKNNHNLTLQQIEALKNELSIITQQKEQFSTELKQLQQEYDKLKQVADEATETKNRVDVELKKFVEELQTMLPLPKS